MFYHTDDDDDASHAVNSKDVNLRARHTMDDVHIEGMLHPKELSKVLLEGVGPIATDEDEIKKLPRKLRGYYENLALLIEHYTEVDELLASSVPVHIATSFKPSRSKSPRAQISPLTTAATTHGGLDLIDLEEGQLDLQNGRSGSISNSNFYQHDDASASASGSDESSPLLFTSETKQEKRDRLSRIALHVNFAVNLLLLLGKGGAVLSSSSISLVASFVDSALDFLSTIIILGTSLLMGRTSDRHIYPAGKKRFEPLGVLIFAVAMIASFVQVSLDLDPSLASHLSNISFFPSFFRQSCCCSWPPGGYYSSNR